MMHLRSHFEADVDIGKPLFGIVPLGYVNSRLTDNATLPTQIGRDLQVCTRSDALQGMGS